MSYIIKGNTSDWEVVIGLEVHAQITSEAKLFSGAATKFGAEPNSQVSLVDAAMPGMLPVINAHCVAQAVKTGLGLGAEINLTSVFERKNYFYPDLPQGYQISQFLHPIVGEGIVVLDMPEGRREIGIERLHMEQDAGKSLHDQDPKRTFIDLNRSGVALMEIVSKPDLRSPDEVGAYLRKLRAILRYLGTCDGNMEQGSMRCDVNVSVRKVGETDLRTRSEIKNVNSMRFAMQAVVFEAARQVDLFEDGGDVVQETRLFDAATGETRSMRSKEEAHDYRYFPDPDLLPLVITQDYVDDIAATLPELPDTIKTRFMHDHDLSADDAEHLVTEKETAYYFEAVLEAGLPAKLAANWTIHELFGKLSKEGLAIVDSPVSATALGKLLKLTTDGTISGRIAKEVFEIMWDTGGDPETIVAENGLKQITDSGEIEA
ncbi:MAG: Asp-tRNA(Asn)/Glu-tRNA(Gln) amidotransferase subunit GatB, partial [Rhodospirillaceae bacterium]|nr:Asp-tRNA(Asn)/Glu-tRNA(Gln) amidotransferase subunit GatB [Rhodospirillaceae bacterium]